MNLPTNKLRDLIAVLQTLDPDIETDITCVSATVDHFGKRILSLDEMTDRYDRDVLDKLSDKLAIAELEPTDDTVDAYAAAIDQLAKDLKDHSDELETLEARHADLREEYDRLSYRLDNIREVLQSATSIL